jgi:aspartyl-tRNA(Asn)/glutamyl-tRNA(Gln) amidotransferase subunit A
MSAFLSLTEAADAIAAGKVSSRELTEECLGRIERHAKRLNCFIRLEGEAALKAAEAADKARARGENLGKLHGVPLAHKDMYYRAGKVSTCGSKILKDRPAPTTATALRRIDEAGALDLGTLNMAEFAFGPTGHNYHFGHCRNPWNTDCVTGGSSSGSGSSVAARLVFGALGSDTGGSIRMPASFCGLAGIKPTWGRVSRHGAMPLSFSLDTVGPLTRRVKDSARILGLIAGADPNDPTASAEPVPDYEAECGRSVKGLRIGVSKGYFERGVSAEVGSAVAAAVQRLKELGGEVVEVTLPDMDEISALMQAIIGAEAAAYHAKWLRTRPDDYSPQVRGRLEGGFGIGAVHYLEALRVRGEVTARFVETVFSRCDALATPTLPMAAAKIAETDVGGGPDMLRVLGGFTIFTRPGNYLGLPALSIPCGFDGGGMPIGLQLMGRPFDEATLFRLGHAYEDATEWHRKPPPE